MEQSLCNRHVRKGIHPITNYIPTMGCADLICKRVLYLVLFYYTNSVYAVRVFLAKYAHLNLFSVQSNKLRIHAYIISIKL